MLAKELAEKESDPARKAELMEMSRICGKVPYEPAESFREAVQSVWLIQLILQIESNGHSLSYGRFDQYMYPYYIKDIREGKITEAEALELLTCLWIKTLTVNKVRSQAHTLSSAGSPMYQNVTIGGQTTDKMCIRDRNFDNYRRALNVLKLPTMYKNTIILVFTTQIIGLTLSLIHIFCWQ